MNDEKFKTRVIFAMSPLTQVCAGQLPLFPECIAFLLDVPANRGKIMSYAHIGQHGEASYDYFTDCKLATPEQYDDLKKELESIGYLLTIVDAYPQS